MIQTLAHSCRLHADFAALSIFHKQFLSLSNTGFARLIRTIK